ncbi:MAG: translation elongation factor Ts [Rikenellaceae bacterium]|jgi:elongation factor Ts|nr:translation elongation factor Ts [Rikenellaceae bacterium]
MNITAADVAKLRKMTGAGMMDCKNALIEANGDFERAQEIIREKGKLIASKRADHTATEGVVVSKVVDGKKGYLLCLACETDFVAKNEAFAASANEILDIALANDCADLDALMATVAGGKTVAEIATEKSGQTGEKVEIPYYARIEAPMCVTYIHMNSKLGTLIGFNKEVPAEVAKDVAMQAAAMAPVSISEADCPADVLEKERQIGREQARLEGKLEAMLDKIADGKLKKYLSENTLLNQALVKNNKITVAQFIKDAVADATVVAYKRFSLND